MKRHLPTIGMVALWLLALAVIVFAAWLSHSWRPSAGVDLGGLILFLAILALVLPSVRHALRRADSFKTPFLEVGLTASVQAAAARALEVLPDVREDSESSSDVEKEDGVADVKQAPRQLRVIADLWPEEYDASGGDAAASLSLLRRRLKIRLNWLFREFYDGARASTDFMGAIAKLQADRRIDKYEAEVTRALLALSEPEIITADSADGERVRLDRFLRAADAIVNQIRLRAMDRSVRRALEKSGFTLIDFKQKRGRWPDFFACKRLTDDVDARPIVLRVAVRVTMKSDSQRHKNTRNRLLKRKPETPMDAEALLVIVVPDQTEVEPSNCEGIFERKRSALTDLLVEVIERSSGETTKEAPPAGGNG